jgi:hypothetical protein
VVLWVCITGLSHTRSALSGTWVPVARDPCSSGTVVRFGRQPFRIDDDYPLASGPKHPLLTQLAQCPDDHLTRRPDCVGKLLLADRRPKLGALLASEARSSRWRSTRRRTGANALGISAMNDSTRSLSSSSSARATRASRSAARRSTDARSTSRSVSVTARIAAGNENGDAKSDARR